MKLLKKMLLQDNSPPKRKRKIKFLTINSIITMKTIKLFISATILFTITVNSQITKGNWLVGGTGNLSSYESKYFNNNVEVTNKGFGANLSPNVGYFFADKFAAGTTISIGYTKPKGYDSSFSYGFGPFVRYYFLKEEKQINLFAQAKYIFGNTKTANNKSQSNGYGFKAGSVLFFNSSVGLEVSLDYDSSTLKPNGSSNSTYNNIQIGLGFQIHLEK